MINQETASWILTRIRDNDPSKYQDELTASEVIFYLEGWGEDYTDELIQAVLDLSVAR